MKVATPAVIPLHMQRDGPVGMDVEQVRIVELETPAYKGPTTVTPQVGAEVTLQTQGYKLLRDVTVREVQVKIVSAPGGGLTYSIE